jgi:predicted HTH transcriptional regulator
MKKASLEALVTLLTDTNALPEVRDEIVAELSKGKAKADANRELYAQYHEKVIAALSVANAPVTAQDLADETKIARGKIVYGLKNYWADEVVVDNSGKANTYRLK